jgi:hypothetical protein
MLNNLLEINMTKKKANRVNVLRVRLSDHEFEKLKAFAESHDQNVSHIIREYIRRLPNT